MSATRFFLQVFVFSAALISTLTGCASPKVTAPGTSSSATSSLATPSAATVNAQVKPNPTLTAPVRPRPSAGGYLTRPEVQAFAQNLADSSPLTRAQIDELLAQAVRSPSAIRLMTPPAPGLPRAPREWDRYQSRFVEPIRINKGKAFMAAHRASLSLAEERYGVPANVIAAIIGVETLYGEHLGNYRVLDAITSLSFDYPDPLRPDRIEMFQGQLADLIELHYQGKVDATRQLGSYAGAMGIPQFMPTSLKRWAVPANPDRAINLENHVDDAILSVANFLVEHGWIRGLPVFAPVRLPADPAKLVAGGLIPTLTWPELEAQGATIANGAPPNSQWMEYPLGVIDLPTSSQNRVEYRTATPNFFALTQYNRSYFYATAVEDLAQALIGAASAAPSPALSLPPSARLR